jgi:hypothetical protein
MSASDIFIARYGTTSLPYAAEIVAGLRDGSARVTHAPSDLSPASASELLHTYERRAKHVSKFPTSHAAQLWRDAEAFCASLKERKSDRCLGWGIERDPHFIYWIWEWASDSGFIGAIKAVDDRKISEAERRTLWGEKKSA